jgi:hypothetical protein
VVTVRLKGVTSVRSGGKVYHYAWRGGPRLKGEPGSPEYLASFNAAHAARKAPVTRARSRRLTKPTARARSLQQARRPHQRAYAST